MKLKKQFKMILWFLILGLITYGSYYIYQNYDELFKKENPKEKTQEKKEEKEKIYKLSLITAGDALLHGSVYKTAYNGSTYDFTDQISLIKPIVQNYDLAFYNQETIFGGSDLGYSSYPMFNSPSEFGDAMIDAGFNMVSLANNHTLDKGEKGILNAVGYWKEKSNVLFSGAADSLDYRDEIKIAEKNNITYSLLSYTTLTNGLKVPTGKDYLVNVYNEEKVKEDIEKIRDKVDIVMVAMHWGVEYTHTPTAEQEEIANYLANLGVDIVIGHHPHVIQPITKINKTVVIYSLGNLVSAQIGTEKLVGMMSTLDITKKVKGQNIEITVDNLGADLIYTYYNNFKNYKIVPFSIMEDKYLSNSEAVYNKYKEIILRMDNTIRVKGLKEDIME